MGKTSIEWTQETWNPVRGCSKISPGCENCYAMHVAARFSGPGQPYQGLAKRNPTNWTGEVRLIEDALFEPLKRRRATTYFVNSMSDLFHEKLPFEAIDYVVAAMALAPQHTFQVLTKRAERMREYFGDPALGGRIYRLVSHWLDLGQPGPLGRQWDRCHDLASESTEGAGRFAWTFWRLPLPNLWLGVSVENQQYAEERIPQLIETPAAVRFLSCEPLLGSIDLDNWLCDPISHLEGRPFDWVIVGGESGNGESIRRCDIRWIRSIISQCNSSGVPCFVKQLGRRVSWGGTQWPGDAWPRGRLLSPDTDSCNGYFWRRLEDKKGGDWNEWPEDLRVREMPQQQLTEAAR